MTMVDFEVRWGELVWRVLDPRDRRLAREGCWYAEAPETARRIVAVESFMANNSARAIMVLSLKRSLLWSSSTTKLFASLDRRACAVQPQRRRTKSKNFDGASSNECVGWAHTSLFDPLDPTSFFLAFSHDRHSRMMDRFSSFKI